MDIPTWRAYVSDLKASAGGRQVAQSLGLHGRGKRFFCPSCQPQGGRTPDLSVTDRGFFCFKCGKHGDIVALVRIAHGVDFRDAVDWLGVQLGKPIPCRRGKSSATVPETSKQGPWTNPKGNDSAISVEYRAEIYESFLAGCRLVGGRAMDYLTGRGIASDVVKRLGLRFCGKEYPEVMRCLQARYGEDHLLSAGLLARGKKRPYPAFWSYFVAKVGFLVIPYIQGGRLVYLKVRPAIAKAACKAKGLTRFLNTTGTVPCLYNIDTLTVSSRVLICEGETDTLTALTHGYDAVGIPGWSHFKLEWAELFRGKEVFLVLDADEGGTKGVRRIALLFERAGLPLPRQIELPLGVDLNGFFS